ncbi:MAG: UbiD family decarboxylase [Pseudomonadota bacterium]|nr:UbiD family decarboxylase [Pseudomonadota bacterium]
MVTSLKNDPVPDLDRFRLRRFVEEMLAEGEIEVIEEPIDLADVAIRMDGNEKAVLFKKAGPEKAELIGSMTGGRRRMAKAFGVEPQDLLAEVNKRLAKPQEVIEIASAEAPVQEVVVTGDDVDLTALPVHLQHEMDGGPYISASLDYVVNPETGWTNTGARRLMLRGKQETGIDLVAPSDLKAIYEKCASKGERLSVAFTVGAHPCDHVAAVMRLPVDELPLVAQMRGATLPVVKCVTSDIRVPADAEYVIEGYLDERGHVEPEGPYGEFLGYYGVMKQNPVFHATAITRRKDALFQTSTISGEHIGWTDTTQLNAIRAEVTVWRALQTAVREPVGVNITTSSGGSFNVRIALRQRVPGEARNAIAATMGSLANSKHVFVVDPDVDIFDDAQMDWALATRFQASRDLVVETGFRTLPLDPSLGGKRIGAKAGFDLTLPLGERALEHTVPKSTISGDKTHDTVEAALVDGPKPFGALMAAVGSKDGRDVVLALDELRQTGRLRRVDGGLYGLADA